jgi:hypothetical protein
MEGQLCQSEEVQGEGDDWEWPVDGNGQWKKLGMLCERVTVGCQWKIEML